MTPITVPRSLWVCHFCGGVGASEFQGGRLLGVILDIGLAASILEGVGGV